MSGEQASSKAYEDIRDIPTDVLAQRFVGELIRAKGNLRKYEALAAMLIRGLRGEPDPAIDAVKTEARHGG